MKSEYMYIYVCVLLFTNEASTSNQVASLCPMDCVTNAIIGTTESGKHWRRTSGTHSHFLAHTFVLLPPLFSIFSPPQRYMELMQKQRQELENILAQRIREQEDALIRQSNTLLQQKEEATQKIVEKVIGAAEADYEAQLTAAKERLEKEIGAKFEKEFGNELKKAKTEYANELNAKVAALQDLASKVQNLQSALNVSRTFEAGSLVAHKVSAAAMALAEKLETSQGAAVELSALEVSITIGR